MGPKKGVTGVAAVQKDVKEKKAAAAPNHPAYKGQSIITTLLKSHEFGLVLSLNHLLTRCADMIKEAILNVSVFAMRLTMSSVESKLVAAVANSAASAMSFHFLPNFLIEY